jgi:hypothetical protein
MSRREQIVADIILALRDTEDPIVSFVSREPFDYTQLSRQQFPAVYVATADEQRRDLTQRGTSGLREGRLQVALTGFVNGNNIDVARNDLIERVEERLDRDRTRGGYAYSTQLTEVAVDMSIVQPYGRVDMIIEVVYTYQRGAA